MSIWACIAGQCWAKCSIPISEDSEMEAQAWTNVEDVGFVNFLLDSGSSGALITAELRERLGLSPSDGQAKNIHEVEHSQQAGITFDVAASMQLCMTTQDLAAFIVMVFDPMIDGSTIHFPYDGLADDDSSDEEWQQLMDALVGGGLGGGGLGGGGLGGGGLGGGGLGGGGLGGGGLGGGGLGGGGLGGGGLGGGGLGGGGLGGGGLGGGGLGGGGLGGGGLGGGGLGGGGLGGDGLGGGGLGGGGASSDPVSSLRGPASSV
ncbi:hypothetical protein VOLCADRAFT_92651 [Volvox carteri f. nagariensis]|uniref:Peptidase A2 domain-containing protein n=1 Tax=Volvox carteri f. nagariensis TaxID=3068 RepID=D8U073_VOLCA|nr:uncharacterized protein VOLCADRAFT_92651 [Volvox carteri f. nagariensis]EFJ46890.1 hypothetical protein VOLCADRAFT_92651 [Volvox carteri f. nagariensis]|eukprot:XP_002952099.1 hypothetical protein VOLCADRAFT_92651 [Volvox carteri f. nagariensis]